MRSFANNALSYAAAWALGVHAVLGCCCHHGHESAIVEARATSPTLTSAGETPSDTAEGQTAASGSLAAAAQDDCGEHECPGGCFFVQPRELTVKVVHLPIQGALAAAPTASESASHGATAAPLVALASSTVKLQRLLCVWRI